MANKVSGGWFLIVIFFVTGIIVGSFLNFLIYRLPRVILENERYLKKNLREDFSIFLLSTPPCPCMGRVSGLINNFSLFRLIWSKICNCKCGYSASIQYIIIELTCALGFIFIVVSMSDLLSATFICIFFSAMLLLLSIDIKHMLLPDAITLPLMWCGFLWNSTGIGMTILEDAVWGAVFGYVSLWLANYLYLVIRKCDGMGRGDFKLTAALGAWTGLEGLQFLLILSPLLGVIYCFFLKNDDCNKIPFGPALIISSGCYFFYNFNFV